MPGSFVIRRKNVSEEEKIILVTDAGEEITFTVLEQTRINGKDYLLVTDSDDPDSDGDCYILRDTSGKDDNEAVYEFVEDDDELDNLFGIFTELMSDTDVELRR